MIYELDFDLFSYWSKREMDSDSRKLSMNFDELL